MIEAMSLQAIAAVTGAHWAGDDFAVTSIATDTRKIHPGSAFVALGGERFDGHDFIGIAHERGAVAAIVDHRVQGDVPQLEVADTLRALGDIAWLNRQKFAERGGLVLALTGSCGKTSCKEMLAAILKQRFSVLATQGNLNNEIGVPLTLLDISADHNVAVVEMGAAKPGDIGYLCEFAQPDISLITNVAPAHLEGFGSVAAVASTKGEIYTSLSETGVAVINLDDPFAGQWRESTRATRVLTASLENAAADFYTCKLSLGEQGTTFELCTPDGSAEVVLPLLGRAMVANAVMAAAAAAVAGASVEDIVAGLNSLQPTPGRLFPRKTSWGLLIDDSYNANPASVKAAIDVLAGFSGRKILVLGDMAELGADSKSLHKQVGQYAQNSDIDFVMTCGVESQAVTDDLSDRGFHFDNKSELMAILLTTLRDNDTVLVKGSRSAGMEAVVEAIAGSQVTGGKP